MKIAQVAFGLASVFAATFALAQGAADKRRSGYQDMGEALQKMQDDDTANPGMLFVQLLHWQSVRGFTALDAGLALVPMAVVYILVSPFSGLLQEKFGTRFATGGGVAIIGSGLLTLGATAGIGSILPAEIGLMLCGLGMGIATGPLTGVAIGAVEPARSGTASALINVARMVGATVGVAVLGAVYALAGRTPEAVTLAMLLGGAVQVGSALICWRATRKPAAQ